MNPKPIIDLLMPQRITEIVDIGANSIEVAPPYAQMLKYGGGQITSEGFD